MKASFWERLAARDGIVVAVTPKPTPVALAPRDPRVKPPRDVKAEVRETLKYERPDSVYERPRKR